MNSTPKQPFERVSAFWPTGVAILSGTDPAGQPFRVTVSSVAAASTAPPMISLALHRQSSRRDHFVDGAPFALHLLGEGHDGWAKATDDARLSVAPDGAVAALACRTRTVVPAGDHVLVLADVLDADARPGRPLVYWRRAFWRVDVRHAFLADEATLEDFVARFHGHRLAKAEWTHGAHVAVCAYHAWGRDAEATFAVMKPAIRAFNESVGTANTTTSGYHETLTRLWATVVSAFLREQPVSTRWDAVCAAVDRFGEDRDLHRLYYRHDVVNDTTARASWVPPDRVAVGA